MVSFADRVSSLLARLVLFLFAAIYLCISVQIVFFNTSFSYSIWMILLLTAAICSVLAAAVLFAYRHRAMLIRRRYQILTGVLLFVFLAQLYFGIVTRQSLDHDYGKVFNGAVLFAEKGDSADFEPYRWYFHHYENNAGSFLLLYTIYRGISMIGITDYYGASVLLGHLIFSATILFTFLYLDRAYGPGAALFSLALYLVYLPIYLQSSVFYTDTLSIFVPPAVLFCHVSAKRTTVLYKKALFYGFAGLCLAYGAEIKMTSAFIGIAVLIEVLIGRDWKNALTAIVSTGLAFVLFFALFNSYKFALVLDRERLESEGMPYTHWIMMGLAGDGSYNPEDEWGITCTVAGVEARKNYNRMIIERRLHKMGFSGVVELMHRKTCRTFGCGNGDLSYTLARIPDSTNHWVYSILLPERVLNRPFEYLFQAVYLSFYVAAIPGALLALIKKNRKILKNIAPFAALIGFFLFMMLWESNHRQLINQWPLFIITASVGAVSLFQTFRSKDAKAANETL